MTKDDLMDRMVVKEAIPCTLFGDVDAPVVAEFGVGEEDSWLYFRAQINMLNLNLDLTLSFGEYNSSTPQSDIPTQLRRLADQIEANVKSMQEKL